MENRTGVAGKCLTEMRVGQGFPISVLSACGTRPFMALILVLAFAFPVRIWVRLGPFASFSPMDVILLVGLGGLLLRALAGAEISTGPGPLALALAVPVLFCYCSFLWTIDRTETLKAALTYTEAFAAFLITIAVFDDLRSETIARLLEIFVSLLIVTAILSEFGFPGLAPQIPPTLVSGSPAYAAFVLSYHARLSHPFIGLSNNLATVLAFFPITFSAYAKATKRNSFHWLALLCALAVVLTLSRGVILALIVSYGFSALSQRISLKQLWRSGGVLALIAATLLVFIMTNPVMRHHLADRLAISNIDQRLETWRIVWTALAEHPFLGYGAGVSVTEVLGGLLKNPHNTYLAQIFFFGLPGGFFVAGTILLIPILFLLWPFSSAEACLMRRGIIFSLVAQMLVFVSEASFEGSVLRVLFYFSIGASVVLLEALEREHAGVVPFVSGKCGRVEFA